MTDETHTLCVQLVLGRDVCELVDSRCDVLECSRPAAPRIADSPILDIPCRKSARSQSIGKSCYAATVVDARHEAATVNDNGNGKRPLARGDAQVCDLKRRSAVANRRD